MAGGRRSMADVALSHCHSLKSVTDSLHCQRQQYHRVDTTTLRSQRVAVVVVVMSGGVV